MPATNAKDIDQKSKTLLSTKRPMHACKKFRAEKNVSFVFAMIVCKVLRRKLKQELLILMVIEEVLSSNSTIGVVYNNIIDIYH